MTPVSFKRRLCALLGRQLPILLGKSKKELNLRFSIRQTELKIQNEKRLLIFVSSFIGAKRVSFIHLIPVANICYVC
jgi:hypothetical protein